MISFNSIPIGGRTPGSYIEFDASRATSGLAVPDNRVLLIGQRISAGTVAALIPTVITHADQAITFFGRGSQLARMAKAFKAADQYSELVAIALDDVGAGTAATGTIVVTGPATVSGTIALMIAGQSIPVVVSSGTASTAIATAIGAAINAALDLPVTATVATSTVTLTARHKGTFGNEIDVRHSHNRGENLPTGVGLTITPLSGGATDPDYASIWAIIGDANYRTIIIGTATATTLTAVKAELDSRNGPLRMLDCAAYAGKSGTQGSLAAFGDAQNNQYVTVIGSAKSPSPPWEWAASYAAICGYYSQIDPARPLHTLVLPGLVPPKEEQLFTRAERELLLKDGIATWTADTSGVMRIERAITTYQLNAAGIADTAYLDIETVHTLATLRFSLRTRIATKFPRHKLADDDTNFGAGQAIVTPKIIRADVIALAREWEQAGWVENLDQFIADIIVQRNASDPNRVDVLLPPDLVNQFRSFAAQIQFRL